MKSVNIDIDRYIHTTLHYYIVEIYECHIIEKQNPKKNQKTKKQLK